MNKPDAALAPPLAPTAMVRGTPLSMAGAPPGASAVSIEVAPVNPPILLENFADNFGVGWLAPGSRELRIQLHLVSIFGRAATERFWISTVGGRERFALSITQALSPIAGQRQAHVPWGMNSRFVVDETVTLSRAAAKAARLEILAEVAGVTDRIGYIYVAKPLNDIARPNAASCAVQALLARVRRINRLLLFVVILPTLIATVYYGLIASDVYISQSKFIVRGAQQQSMSPLTMLFKGADFGRSQDDSYSVQEFILSRDALRKLDADMGLGRDFASKKVDIFSRFGGLDWDDSFEALYKYYQKKVVVQIDGASSIVTLTTRAFTANDALRANQLLLGMSEALVNQLNDQGRQDMIRFAEREVADAEKRDQQATMALARVQTGGAASFAKGRSLAGKFSEYQRLALEKDYSDKLLASALSSLQEARDQAMRKQLYLERIAQPSAPDRAMEPRRLRSVAAVLVLGLIVWGVLSMLIAGIKEHQD